MLIDGLCLEFEFFFFFVCSDFIIFVGKVGVQCLLFGKSSKLCFYLKVTNLIVSGIGELVDDFVEHILRYFDAFFILAIIEFIFSHYIGNVKTQMFIDWLLLVLTISFVILLRHIIRIMITELFFNTLLVFTCNFVRHVLF